MKRSGPPERRTPLRANRETTRAWEQRSRDAALAREREEPRTAARGALRARSRASDVPGPVRAAVLARAGGRCEAGLPGCTDRGLAPHHRLRSGQGGPSTVENLVLLCSSCHTGSPAAVHRNVAWAERVGLLIRSHAGPPAEAWDPKRLDTP